MAAPRWYRSVSSPRDDGGPDVVSRRRSPSEQLASLTPTGRADGDYKIEQGATAFSNELRIWNIVIVPPGALKSIGFWIALAASLGQLGVLFVPEEWRSFTRKI